jgi:hypothetical protein
MPTVRVRPLERLIASGASVAWTCPLSTLLTVAGPPSAGPRATARGPSSMVGAPEAPQVVVADGDPVDDNTRRKYI